MRNRKWTLLNASLGMVLATLVLAACGGTGAEASRLDLRPGVVVAFAAGPSSETPGKVAYITHVPSGSQMVIDRKGQVVQRHDGRDDGPAHLEAVLADKGIMSRITAGTNAEDRSPPQHADWINFVKFEGITYVANRGRGMAGVDQGDLGVERYRVAFMLRDHAGRGYRSRDGDAAFLDTGTPVFQLKHYDPKFRLAAVVDGEVTLFEADTNPAARTGADLLDIRDKVRLIGINSPVDGYTRLASISDLGTVQRLVEMVLEAPIDQDRRDHQGERYFIAFNLEDNTAVVRSFWLESGELSRGIMTPAPFRDSIIQALAGARASSPPGNGAASVVPQRPTTTLVAPTATATPTPPAAPFFRDPTPTPLPLSGLQKVEYDLRSYRISDLSDGKFVSIGPDGEVYLVDIESGGKEQLTNDGIRKWEAVLSGGYVAWIDQRRQIKIYDSPRRPPEGLADDIFLYNLATGELKRITEAPARRYSLSISGSRLVWADRRNETGEHYTHADIYSYDITTGREQPVVVAPGSQQSPNIRGDLVVWQDNRNSPTLGTPNSGCGDCPDNRYDIYLYNFSTGRERPLIESQFYKENPSIYDNYVVWQDFRNGWASDVYLLDLATGEEHRLTDDGGPYVAPMISGSHIIWTRRFACDVGGGPERYDNTGVYAYNLNDGEVRQLSNYIEPRAMIRDDVVLIEEGCFFAQRIYSVSLRGNQ